MERALAGRPRINLPGMTQNCHATGSIHDPHQQCKLSPMDLESRRRWEEYTRAKEVMLERTHITEVY